MSSTPQARMAFVSELPAPQFLEEGVLYFVGYPDDDSPFLAYLGFRQGRSKPVGAPASIAGYKHVQVSPATVWVVNHNLGYRPLVAILKDGVTPVEAAINHVSINQAEIIFLLPTAGSARLV